MKYHLVSAALLGAALVLESAGFGAGVALLGAGVACEVWFWTRVVRGRGHPLRAPSS
jgi:hypothetical protein